MDTKHSHVQKICLSGMFLALGLVLPLLTGQIPRIGNMMLPMHIPVLLCGLICGWGYGGAVGLICPLLRNVIFGAPPMPNAVSMAFELCTYGLVIGLAYGLFRRKNVVTLYGSMILAMILGRIVWGIAQMIVMGVAGNAFTVEMFMAGAFLNAIPGIILQLILIPAIMIALDRAKLVPFCKKESEKAKED